MKKSVVYLFSLLVISCSVWRSMEGESTQIDQLFKEYNSDDWPGAAVMVIKDGRKIVHKGYGLAQVENKILVTPETNFRLASVSKQFTAISVLQLIQAEKLTLDRKLTDIFADFPDYGRSISIRDLLQHTSGLLDYENLVPAEQEEQVKDADVLSLMKNADSSYFAAGEKYKYSNSAYALLTQVLEKLTDQPYREYLQQNIFKPLGMKNSLAFEKGINTVSNRAFGYTVKKDGIIEASDQSRFSAVLGDGGIYSNLNDLYLWDQALYNYALLDKKWLDQAFSKQQTNSGEFFDYGFGWRLENYKGMDVKYHTGSSRGFRTILYRIPQEFFTIVILTNRNGGSALNTLQLAHKITDVFLK